MPNAKWNDFNLTGYIPEIISDDDPRRARDQIDANYAHGGGFMPFEGFTLHTFPDRDEAEIHYRGDPPTYERARTVIHKGTPDEELIIVFDHDWVCIVQLDGSFQISRMD